MSLDSPFSPLPSHASFYETPAAADALLRLGEGLGAREPFLVVTGEPGTGKTALAHEAVARWGSRVRAVFLAYPALTGAELVEEIIRRFGAEPPQGASRPRLMASFEWALAENTQPDQVALLVVDDAHDLAPELLQELRLLANATQQARRPFEVMLVGLPALETHLDQPALAALRQRVSVRVTLEPLGAGETRRYLHHRVTAAGGDGPEVFPRKAARDIAALSGGVPRRINSLAAEAMRLARAAGESAVAPAHVHGAAAALWGAVPKVVVREEPDPDPAPPGHGLPTPAAVEAGRAAEAPRAAEVPRADPAPRAAEAARVAEVPRAAEPRATEAPRVPEAPRATTAPRGADAPGASASQRADAAPRSAEAPRSQPTPKPGRPKREPHPAHRPADRARAADPPAPAAPPAQTPPAPAPPSLRPWEEPVVVTPSAAPSQDREEWIKRFVGDKGPLQIGSRRDEELWAAMPLDDLPPAAAAPGGAASGAPSRSDVAAGAASRAPGGAASGAPAARAVTDAPGGAASGAPPAAPAARRRRPRPSAGRPRRGVHGPALLVPLGAIVVAAAVVLVLRSMPHGELPRAVVTAAVPPVPPPSPRPAVESRAKKPAPPREREPREREPAGAAPARGPHTIEVGSYSDLERAYDARDAMQQLTGFEGWVVPAAEEGGRHRVVLGIYRNWDRANDAANMLLRSRTLTRARAVPLPPRDERL